jgi:hypothetical protein
MLTLLMRCRPSLRWFGALAMQADEMCETIIFHVASGVDDTSRTSITLRYAPRSECISFSLPRLHFIF